MFSWSLCLLLLCFHTHPEFKPLITHSLIISGIHLFPLCHCLQPPCLDSESSVSVAGTASGFPDAPFLFENQAEMKPMPFPFPWWMAVSSSAGSAAVLCAGLYSIWNLCISLSGWFTEHTLHFRVPWDSLHPTGTSGTIHSPSHSPCLSGKVCTGCWSF